MNYITIFEHPRFGMHIESMSHQELDKYRAYLETNLADANSRSGKRWRVCVLKPVWVELLRRVEQKLIILNP